MNYKGWNSGMSSRTIDQYILKIGEIFEGRISVIINKLRFKAGRFEYGKGFQTMGTIRIRNKGGKLTVGDNVFITSSNRFNPISGLTKTNIQLLPGASITIGDYAGLSNVSITSAKQITIGKHVFIGDGARIYDTDFHSLDPSVRGTDRDFEETKHLEVTIEDYAFIGTQAIILKGVTIGKSSIVAAGSVVTKSIPTGEIWGGNPAVFIKKLPKTYRINE